VHSTQETGFKNNFSRFKMSDIKHGQTI
jgi:hypothetical protein